MKYHTTMDKALQELNTFLRDGLITIDTYADSISAIRQQVQPIPAPRYKRSIPAPHGERTIPAPQHERSIPAPHGERPIPAPRHKLSIPAPHGERPIPAPRRKQLFILDEPIPAAVQERLSVPLIPRKNQRGLSDKDIDGILDEIYPDSPNLAFFQIPWVIGKFLRGWQTNVPEGHSLEVDRRAFLEGVRPQIHSKLEEELQALHGLKFQLAINVQLSKDVGDGI